ncbi:MAG: hypothetical protein EXS68_02130 [Candidatus Ryanbacteria bacterium]|nr:hypothetical protein [Candidatus Ryanbacteria bacterium]
MNTKTLLAVVGGVVVLGAAIFLFKGPVGNMPGGGERMMSQKTSLKALLAVNSPQKCTFTNKVENSDSSGTVYVMRGRMRGDFTSVAAGKTENSHMIVENDKAYVWGESMPQGMMMNFADFDKPENKQQGTADVNKETDYSCGAWSPDENIFQRPSNVEFMDIQEMMKGAGMMQGGMMDKQPTGGMPAGGADIKAMQCQACANLQEPEKTQCKTALGCK